MDLTNTCFLAYSIKDFKYLKLTKEGTLYKCNFTPQDNALLNTGVIKLIPINMCKFIAPYAVTIGGVKYNPQDEVDVSGLNIETIKVLLRNHVLKFALQEEYNEMSEEDLVKVAKINNYIGAKFITFAEDFNIDFEIVKEAFGLKQGAKSKTIKKEDIPDLLKIIGE